MEEQARRVSAALDRLGVRRATIIGHSMGGSVATALTELRRPLIESLVLIDSASGKDDSTLPFTARLGFVPVLGEAIQRVVPDAMIRAGLESAFADGFDVPDRFVDDVRDMTYTSYDDSRAASEDYRDERSVAERLADAKVPVPLLVIFGSQDDIAKPESAADYKVVPGARIVLMDGAGHSPHVEKPAATARLIRNFLDQRPAN
jgi:pimeloyl-ACP methyl ester carboxylesterase